MKRIKSLCIALVLALLVTYVPVSAAVQDDTMIKMQQKDTSQVELALYPNGDMIKNHSTTFRIQMRITEAESGSIGEIHFAFSEEIQNRCKIREYFYENGILDIYFSSAGTVFEQAQDVVIGTISGTPSGEMFQASIAPESIMYVDLVFCLSVKKAPTWMPIYVRSLVLTIRFIFYQKDMQILHRLYNLGNDTVYITGFLQTAFQGKPLCYNCIHASVCQYII